MKKKKRRRQEGEKEDTGGWKDKCMKEIMAEDKTKEEKDLLGLVGLEICISLSSTSFENDIET